MHISVRFSFLSTHTHTHTHTRALARTHALAHTARRRPAPRAPREHHTECPHGLAAALLLDTSATKLPAACRYF